MVARALLIALAALVGAAGPAAAAQPAEELPLVAVVEQPQGRMTAVVELRPAPLAPLPQDAATVTAAGTRIPTTLTPVLASGTPVGLVMDASRSGRTWTAGMLSGAAGLLLQLSERTPVTAVADRAPSPSALSTTTPSAAISALSDLRAEGERATPAALELALRRLPATQDRTRVVVLCTTGSAPTGPAAEALADRFRSSRTALAVVATGPVADSWSKLATGTGGVSVTMTRGSGSGVFDEVLRTLRARYTVSFDPPADADRVTVRIESAAGTHETDAALPVVAGASSSQAAGAAGGVAAARDPRAGLPAGPAVLVPAAVAAALGVAVLVAIRRRRAAAAVPAVRAASRLGPASGRRTPPRPSRDARPAQAAGPAKAGAPAPAAGPAQTAGRPAPAARPAQAAARPAQAAARPASAGRPAPAAPPASAARPAQAAARPAPAGRPAQPAPRPAPASRPPAASGDGRPPLASQGLAGGTAASGGGRTVPPGRPPAAPVKVRGADPVERARPAVVPVPAPSTDEAPGRRPEAGSRPERLGGVVPAADAGELPGVQLYDVSDPRHPVPIRPSPNTSAGRGDREAPETSSQAPGAPASDGEATDGKARDGDTSGREATDREAPDREAPGDGEPSHGEPPHGEPGAAAGGPAVPGGAAPPAQARPPGGTATRR